LIVKIAILALSSTLILAGCATVTDQDAGPAARATLLTTANETRGQVEISPIIDGGLNVAISVRGAAPGRYGIHIHAIGLCEGPGFISAGPHWNPDGRQHGRNNPAGMHHGDLPNIVVGTDGTGQLDAELPGTLAQLFDADGASVILHAAADDEVSDPTGNSGARVACGVLRAN
jgi:Cu-Zn family superoxide dismutase